MPKQTVKKQAVKSSPANVGKSVANKTRVSEGLTREEKKRLKELREIKAKQHKKGSPKTAQQSIPYKEIFIDGTCQLTDTFFTKTIQFYDINYQLAQNEDKTSIFENYCEFLNYFDSSIQFQLTFLNQQVNFSEFAKTIDISEQDDDFNEIRKEYADMLKTQLAKGNNGLVKTKYITFGITADNLKMAKARLERIEMDILNNFKVLGALARPLNGVERLEIIHNTFNMDTKEPFHFNYGMVAKTGLGTKDFVAPTGFDFSSDNYFRMGKTIGCVSYLQILAPELTDKMLAEFLDLEENIIVNIHVQSVDQGEAIKSLKTTLSNIQKMKIEEQKKAVRSGYDMDIIPTDIATYGDEAQNLLHELQSRNEKMFKVTFLIMNTSTSKRKLENVAFQTAGIAQKYNCNLRRMQFLQEQGLMASLPLGLNETGIQRGLTTSSTAIFVPFTTQELFMEGEALYYGLNALSNNMIMVDRKQLKNPNGLILGTPGCFVGDTRIQMADGTVRSLAELEKQGGIVEVRCYDEEKKTFTTAIARDARITKMVSELTEVELSDASKLQCTDSHLLMTENGEYTTVSDLEIGAVLMGGLSVVAKAVIELTERVAVYDITVPEHFNFVLENGVIAHNSGKSFSAKREILNVFLITNDDVIICDPEGEYAPLVNALNGQVIRISATGKKDEEKQYVNPMDINLNYSDDENPVSLKSDFIISLCELMVGGKKGLEGDEISIIDRCVKEVYIKYLENPIPENMPILEDLYNRLRAYKDAAAQHIATCMEIYVTGSLNVFNHRTNVDINNRIVCFDIKGLGKQLKKIGMLIMQDQVWNRVTINRELKKFTRYYIDEFHLLLKEEQTAAYSVEIWKRFRKWGGIPTGITQNVKDLLSSREIENIFENSDFIYMLNQAAGDRKILAKTLNISPHQLSYVTHSNAGEGLIFYGNVIIPFIDKYPVDTISYSIMTTKPEESKKE